MMRIEPTTVAQQLLAAHVEDLAAAGDDPAAALAQLARIEAATRKARERIVVDAVMRHGWSYAQVGRALSMTRQAALKGYSTAVRDHQRRSIRAIYQTGDAPPA
jgi:hypothetical protein